MVAVFATLLWFGILAGRIPDRRLKTLTRIVMGGFGAYVLWHAIKLNSIYPNSGLWPWDRGRYIYAWIDYRRYGITFETTIGVAHLVFAIAFLVLLLACRRRFAACAEVAARRFGPQRP
ncbi:MAG: hypothetical protein GX591_15960 [Planctomycetes bacterium]|nr:hypothetical protein [Planctomycetota bacterium]